MPFLSKDWRSPGEKWVRYEGGWEMKKTVWNTLQRFRGHSLNLEMELMSTSRESDDSGCDARGVPMEVGSWGSTCSTSPSLSPISFPRMENKETPQPQGGSLLLKKCFSMTKAGGGNENLNRQLSLPRIISQPYYNITLKSTREVAGFNGLAEALLRLDFLNAVKDIRRFNYVSKIMYILFSDDKLSQLPGAAQRVLFRMLEEMADMVYHNNVNEHVLRKLLDELHATMSIYHVWGTHLGSTALFKHHLESKRKITEIVEKMQVTYKQDLAAPTISNANHPSGLVNALPEECIREILLRLSDPKDLERAADTCQMMGTITREKRVWRELVQTHFTHQQIEFIQSEKPDLKGQRDWQLLYKALRWRFGLREDYTETIMLCRKCRVLFWQSLGHPCLVVSNDEASSSSSDDEDEAAHRVQMQLPVPPNQFLSFFSV
eukprot:maker-scaffold197_size267318-snap-gene-0.13 protein:Tk09453 transcript:maker-scaffold197_size267318-snap-gene-0.13-mRNA-1 annotation:"f-box only protein 25"